MAEMETVIKGLECCVKNMGECELCPYDEGQGKCGCGKQLYADALALLKAQEPRVMTLEEVKSAWRICKHEFDCCPRITKRCAKCVKALEGVVKWK